ncbi:TPA: DUF4431 domain-containing protein [Morganella morganii]|nr:DUF4431 domain-containing protein [Morganella morganii]HED3889421.1 DUF4431 domain-containing protein [Morganella morganii]
MLKKLAVGMLFIAGAANAVSFDCSKAYSNVEKLVCSTPSLSKADDELYVDYLQAKLVTGNSDEFKKIVRQNRKLREKNCETVECQLQWYSRSTELYRNIAGSKSTSSPESDCYEEGQQVTLSGTLERTVFPGPPNYESVESGDKPETYWTLNTKDPIKCAKGSADWGKKDQFQLIVSGDFYKENERYLGRKVFVTGRLAYSETGHHHTPIMIGVESMTPIMKDKVTPTPKKDSYGLPIPRSNASFNNFSSVALEILDSPEGAALISSNANDMRSANIAGVAGPVNSTALYYEYKKNEIVANNKYKGKKIRVIGVVESVSEDFTGGGIVKTTSPEMFLGGTMFNVNKKDPYVLNLTPGSTVDMVCIGGGFIMDSPVLRNCVESGKYSATMPSTPDQNSQAKNAIVYAIYMSSEDVFEKQCKSVGECLKYKDVAQSLISLMRTKSEMDKNKMTTSLKNAGLTEDGLTQILKNFSLFVKENEKKLNDKFNIN